MRVRPALAGGATTAALAGAWAVRHLTAPAVRGWRPPERRRADGGPLAAWLSGSAGRSDPVVVLLHGLTASNLSFGRDYDGVAGTVVAVDLLGFGESLRHDGAFDRAAHVSAVVETLEALQLADRELVLVGHSMGAVLALNLASALRSVTGVVALSAPLYDSREEGLAQLGEMGLFERLFAAGDLAEAVCHWMCDHRETAAVLWPLLAPQFPWRIASDGVLHTWPSYSQSLESLVLDSGYAAALNDLGHRGIPVALVNGANDPVPIPGRAASLAEAHAHVTSIVVPDAGHALPMSRPRRCTAIIRGATHG